jgi:hypothetical protein
VAPDPICGDMPEQRRLRPDGPPPTLEEFAEWLVQLEEVFGRDERPRAPTTGERFLL